jgi:hypothetical protein
MHTIILYQGGEIVEFLQAVECKSTRLAYQVYTKWLRLRRRKKDSWGSNIYPVWYFTPIIKETRHD